MKGTSSSYDEFDGNESVLSDDGNQTWRFDGNESVQSDDGNQTWRDVKISCHSKDDFKIRAHILENFVDKILADERFNIGE